MRGIIDRYQKPAIDDGKNSNSTAKNSKGKDMNNGSNGKSSEVKTTSPIDRSSKKTNTIITTRNSKNSNYYDENTPSTCNGENKKNKNTCNNINIISSKNSPRSQFDEDDSGKRCSSAVTVDRAGTSGNNVNVGHRGRLPGLLLHEVGMEMTRSQKDWLAGVDLNTLPDGRPGTENVSNGVGKKSGVGGGNNKTWNNEKKMQKKYV